MIKVDCRGITCLTSDTVIEQKQRGQGQFTVKGSSNRMFPRFNEPILG